MRRTKTFANFGAIVLLLALSAVSSFAQGINYPVGSPTGTSGTGRGTSVGRRSVRIIPPNAIFRSKGEGRISAFGRR